jgi:hypothetical protein
MYEGAACHAGPERRDDVGVSHPWELVGLSRKTPDVVLEAFARLLSAAL